MCKKIIITILLCIVTEVWTTHAIAQNHVSNIRIYQHEATLCVTYDLEVIADIDLYISFDNGNNYRGPLQNVTGSVGKGILPGKDKIILWNADIVGYVDYPNVIAKIVSSVSTSSLDFSTEEVSARIANTLCSAKQNVYFEDWTVQKVYMSLWKLEKAEVWSIMTANMPALNLYQKGRTYRTVGIVSYSMGGVAFAAGTVCFVEGVGNAGVYCMLAGIGFTFVGWRAMIKSEKLMRSAVGIYNSGNNSTANIELDFGFTGNGVGMALRF